MNPEIKELARYRNRLRATLHPVRMLEVQRRNIMSRVELAEEIVTAVMDRLIADDRIRDEFTPAHYEALTEIVAATLDDRL